MQGGPATSAAANVFGKYSLVAKLATGGMAEIYLARLSGAAGFEKLVCIKRILPHLAKEKALVEMFLAEARIAAQISHPNVCQVFELGEIEGRYFIAMEYLEGVPFSCFRRRDMYPAPPDPRLVAGLGIQACEGLHHAHNLKRTDGSPMEVVHRDVSSNNLFATVDGVVKVLDFGIAKVQDASVRTSTGSVKGTYAYMAPEQLRGERVDRRTDVFAVGIVLWELFARRHLFKRETDFLTFQAITTDPIPDVAELRPDVPPELSWAIATALSRNRDERFPSTRALGEALAQSVASIGGALSASQLSDEVARAFEVRLRDQQALLRIAREGGVLSLDDDLGPAVGHGTEMITTPVSMVSGMGKSTVVEISVQPSQKTPIPQYTPPGARSVTIDVPKQLPHLGHSSRWPVVLLAFLAAAGIGAAVYFAMFRDQPQRTDVTASAAPPAAKPPLPQAPAPAATPDAAIVEQHEPAPAIDAAVVETPVDAPVPTVADTRTKPPTPTPKPKSQPAQPAGPPGFITIDSSPVYAVIYIDGRRYGETPLVHQELPPGRHAVRAVSASGTSQSLTITIESGKVAPTRRIEW
jgi:eukaryotic-like serine/threonine-protein kinase